MVVLGGYDNPTTLALFGVLRLLRLLGMSCPLVVLATESNTHADSAKRGFRYRLKRFCVSVADAYVVPGRLAWTSAMEVHAGSINKPVFELPNIIDESVFRDRVRVRRSNSRMELRRDLGVDPQEQMWILPARLETFKGVGLFLEQLSGVRNVKVIVAGDGSQRERLQDEALKMGSPVVFVGHVSEESMVDLYAGADVFVLPSLRDPSPLSAVEALAAGLPVVISRRAGNHAQILGAGNGWLYDPGDPSGMRQLLKSISDRSFDDLARMGCESAKLFESRFNSEQRVASFIRALRDWLSAQGRL